jgi:hypothetical protein
MASFRTGEKRRESGAGDIGGDFSSGAYLPRAHDVVGYDGRCHEYAPASHAFAVLILLALAGVIV